MPHLGLATVPLSHKRAKIQTKPPDHCDVSIDKRVNSYRTAYYFVANLKHKILKASACWKTKPFDAILSKHQTSWLLVTAVTGFVAVLTVGISACILATKSRDVLQNFITHLLSDV